MGCPQFMVPWDAAIGVGQWLLGWYFEYYQWLFNMGLWRNFIDIYMGPNMGLWIFISGWWYTYPSEKSWSESHLG